MTTQIPNELMDEQNLRIGQVCEVLGVGKGKVYELIAAGKLRSVKIGGSRRVSVGAIKAFTADLNQKADEVAQDARDAADRVRTPASEGAVVVAVTHSTEAAHA